MWVSLYLQHHHADLFDTLDDGLRGPGDGHSSLRGVWQHVSCNLDLSPCGLKAGDTAGHQLLHWSWTRLLWWRPTWLRYLSHLFDFGASFSDEGSTLAGRNHQPQGHWGLTGGRAVAHGVDDVLSKAESSVQVIEHEHGERTCGSTSSNL